MDTLAAEDAWVLPRPPCWVGRLPTAHRSFCLSSLPFSQCHLLCDKGVKLIHLPFRVYNLLTYSSPNIKTLGPENNRTIGIRCTWVQVPTLAAWP